MHAKCWVGESELGCCGHVSDGGIFKGSVGEYIGGFLLMLA